LGKITVENFKTQFAQAKRAFLDALFPIHCLGCGKEGGWLCADCLGAVRISPLLLCPGCGRFSPAGTTHRACDKSTPLDALVSFYHYADPVLRGLVKEYKYHGAADIENILAGLTAAGVRSHRTFFSEKAVVVPMPLHPSRERERGFNQAAAIGAATARALGVATAQPLSRVRRTAEQARLSAAQRGENCDRAFKSVPLVGEIILVDDVITSGATMAAAAKALKKAGAQRVTGFAFAHGSGDRFRS
jgi:ComF family protein